MLRFVLFWVAFHALGRLPIPVLYRLMDFAAWVAYNLARSSRSNVLDNLRHVMPPDTPESELRRTARQVFRNVAYYYADVAHFPWTDVHHLFYVRTELHGMEENLLAAVKQGKGVIMLTAHFGNPELAGQGLAAVKLPVFALTEPLKPPPLSRLMDSFRSSQGHTFAPVTVGNVKRVIKTLRSGGVVALMGDRDIEGPRARLPFCGTETLMPTGPIEVALRTGAIVIPSFARRRGRYIIEAYMEEPLELDQTGDFEQDVRNGELRFLERFERRLRTDPGQWIVLERVWDAAGGQQETSDWYQVTSKRQEATRK